MVERKPKSSAHEGTGRFAYEGLERTIHEKARLGILTSLLAHPEGVSFNDLKTLCDLTDGNLNRHLEVLEEGGLIAVAKQQASRRAKTVCHLTVQGRRRFLEYLEELQRVIADAAKSAAQASSLEAAPKLRFSND